MLYNIQTFILYNKALFINLPFLSFKSFKTERFYVMKNILKTILILFLRLLRHCHCIVYVNSLSFTCFSHKFPENQNIVLKLNFLCFVCSASSNGCCVYDQDDCTETYTLLHVYNLMRECSGKNQCGPLPAPSNVLSSCGNNASTYVRIQYDCMKGKDTLRYFRAKTIANHQIEF